ncbi:transcription factor [Pichia kluyveri]|uniref:Transcription factor n=1 Tax=Pichia kluyveri TaxID=36015 RepID=A0AAV5R7J1_PICKL|nr:transcription factor [Pichia kluyveri]
MLPAGVIVVFCLLFVIGLSELINNQQQQQQQPLNDQNNNNIIENNSNNENTPIVNTNTNTNEEEMDDDDDESKSNIKRERRKIEIKFIQDKSRRHITFSKRKAGIMKKAYELSVLTGTQVLLLVVSETGLVYTFTTPKLQPLVTKAEGKNLIQACLNASDEQSNDEDEIQNDQQQQAAPPVASAVPTQPTQPTQSQDYNNQQNYPNNNYLPNDQQNFSYGDSTGYQ